MLATRLPLRLAPRVGHAQFQAAVSQSFFSQSRTFAEGGRPKKDDSKPKSPRRATSTGTKKPATKKAAPKKTAKASLSDEEKAALAERASAKAARDQAKKDKAEIKELKTKALSPPSNYHISAWNVYVKEKGNQNGALGKSQSASGEVFKQTAQDFRNLPSTEREHYNHLANETYRQRTREHDAWVQEHTALQIRDANLARRQLRSKQIRGSWSPIVDVRSVKRAQTGYLIYLQDRFATGDFKGIPVVQAAKDLANEWKQLPASEKKPYTDRAEEDAKRYRKEYAEVYGIEPPASRSPRSNAAVE